MTERVLPHQPALTIAAVERDTGLSKDTLRAWERRYGFPAPLRDRHGERIYSRAEVDRLRLLKRLVDRGDRPGRVISLSTAELQALLDDNGAAARVRQPVLDGFIELIRGHDLSALRGRLRESRRRLGPARFVTEVVAPMNTQVGEAWMRGQLQVFEEHLYTEVIQAVLRETIARGCC